jgi:hypothetical protein
MAMDDNHLDISKLVMGADEVSIVITMGQNRHMPILGVGFASMTESMIPLSLSFVVRFSHVIPPLRTGAAYGTVQ